MPNAVRVHRWQPAPESVYLRRLALPPLTAGVVFDRSRTSVNYANRTNTTLTAPAGIQNGDLLIIQFMTSGPSAVSATPPSGFAVVPGPSFPVQTSGIFSNAYVPSQSTLSGGGSAAVSTFTMTLPNAISPGASVCILAGGVPSAGAATNWTLTDNVTGNTYTRVGPQYSSFSTFQTAAFYGFNIQNSPTTFTLHATSSNTFTFPALLNDVFTGPTAFDDSAANIQATPGTATNAITSLALNPTVSGDLFWGATVDIGSLGGDTPGTGYTQAQYDGSSYLSEYILSNSTASKAVTFTNSTNGGTANSEWQTIGIALKPTTATVNNYTWYKIASGESGNYTVTHNAANSQGWIVACGNANTATPFAQNETHQTGTGTTTTVSGVTTTTNGNLIIFASQDFGTTQHILSGPSSGYVPRLSDAYVNPTDLYISDYQQAVGGTIGSQSITNNNTSSFAWAGFLIAIQPGASLLALLATAALKLRSRALTAGSTSIVSNSAAKVKGRASPFAALLIRARSSAKTKSHALVRATAFSLARSAAKIKSHALARGAASVLARSAAKIKSHASPFVGLFVRATGAAKAKSRALVHGTALTLTRSSAKVKSNALAHGTSLLLARSAAKVKSHATPFVGLLMRTTGAAKAKARAVVRGTSSSFARSAAKVKAHALTRGALPLLARGATQVKSRGQPTIAALLALFIRSLNAVKSHVASYHGTATVRARSATMAKGEAFHSGGVLAFVARSAARVKAHALAAGRTAIAAFSQTEAKTRARLFTPAYLRARAKGQAQAVLTITPTASLHAKAKAKSTGKASARKFMMLFASSITVAKGRATTSLGFLRLFIQSLLRVTSKAFIGSSKLYLNTNYIAAAPVLSWVASDMEAIRDLSPALAGSIEGETITFDFGPRLPPNTTIASIISITAVTKFGFDPTPQNRISGSPQLTSSPNTGNANQAVLQNVFGGIGGVTYLLTCLVQCSDDLPRSIEVCLTFYSPF